MTPIRQEMLPSRPEYATLLAADVAMREIPYSDTVRQNEGSAAVFISFPEMVSVTRSAIVGGGPHASDIQTNARMLKR